MGSRRTLTVRLASDEADELAMAAKIDDRSVNEEIRIAINERLEALRNDPDFKAALRYEIERNKELLAKLAATLVQSGTEQKGQDALRGTGAGAAGYATGESAAGG